MTELTELHRFCNDRHLGGEDALGILDIIRDAEDEKRDVVEKLVARENASRVDFNACIDALEPAPGELFALEPQALC
jgi:hypothetical protein